MAQIIIEIKDGYEVAIAKGLGFGYDPSKVPPLEEHLAAIESKLYSIIEPYYKQAIEQDPDVIAKKHELETLIAQKEALIKGK